MARRSKLTPETHARIVEAIEKGATYELAASYAGVHYDTLRIWLTTKPALSEDVKLAEGRAAIKWLEKIDAAAADGNWQAAAWKLERRYPQMYGRTIQEQHGEQRLTVVYEHDWRRVRLGAGEVVALPVPERDSESEAAS